MDLTRAIPRRWQKFREVAQSGPPLRRAASKSPPWLDHVQDVLRIAREQMSAAEMADRFADVSFHVVDNAAVNARAFRHGDAGLVLMYSGLFDAVCAMIESAVRNPEFLAEWLPLRDSPAAIRFSFASAPKDPLQWDKRTRWGMSFLRRIADFVIHHELAHINRSHHQLLGRRKAGIAIDEALAMHGAGRKGHLYRMMEFDADAIALDHALIEISTEVPIRTWTAGQMEDEFFEMYLVVVLLCQLFDRRQRDMESFRRTSHPAPVLRAIRFGEVLHATFEAIGTVASGRLYDIGDVVWWEASRLAAAGKLREGRWHGDDMRDVPEELVLASRADHIAFVRKFESILEGDN